MLVLFLAFAGSAQAQLFGGDDGDSWRRRYARGYAERVRYNEIDEDRDRWWRRQRRERYRGWWHPEGGWLDSELRDGPRRCRPPMHAAGDAHALRETARNLAIKSWQEQVINEHGERFLNYDAAFVIEEHCDPARVGNENAIIELRRCVVTAAPCLKRYEGDRSREEDERQQRREEERR